MDDRRLGPHHRTTVPPTVHARQFDDEVIVLDLEAGTYFSLDSVGSVIWGELAAGRCLEEAASQVVARFEVDEERALRDAVELANELLALGLLVDMAPNPS